MTQLIDIVSSPEEVLCLKNNIANHCLFDPIDAICDRSSTLCYLLKIYISTKEIANSVVCNIVWQLQGNTDVLDLYLKHFLFIHQYTAIQHFIKKIRKLCSEITFDYADLYQISKQPAIETLYLIAKIKCLFIRIKNYCLNVSKLY